MKKFYMLISILTAITIFIAVQYLFSIIGGKISMPLYIDLDEPILVGSGPGAYEEYVETTSLGNIATYFSCLAAYCSFNLIMSKGFSWLSPIIKLKIVFITIAVLLIFLPVVINSVIFVSVLGNSDHFESLIGLVLQIIAVYINWIYIYRFYSRKKSRLEGFKLWAILSYNENHYVVIEAKTSTEALNEAKSEIYKYHFKGMDLKLDDVKECDMKGNIQLQSEIHKVASYVDKENIHLKT